MGSNLDMAIYASILGMSDREIAEAALLPQAPPTPTPAPTPRRAREPRLRTLIRATVVVTPDPAADLHARHSAVPRGEGGRSPHGAMPGQFHEGMLTLVRNVSEHGMCLVMRGNAPHRGESLCVYLPDGQALRGEVRWNERRACGVELADMLDVPTLVATTQRRHDPVCAALDERFDMSLRPPPFEPAPMRFC